MDSLCGGVYCDRRGRQTYFLGGASNKVGAAGRRRRIAIRRASGHKFGIFHLERPPAAPPSASYENSDTGIPAHTRDFCWALRLSSGGFFKEPSLLRLFQSAFYGGGNVLRFGLFAGRLSHEIALFHCLRAILRFSLELHFLSWCIFLCKLSIAVAEPFFIIF